MTRHSFSAVLLACLLAVADATAVDALPVGVTVPFTGLPQQTLTTSLVRNLFGNCVFLDPGDGAAPQARNQVGDGRLRIVYPAGLWGPPTNNPAVGSGLMFQTRMQSRPDYGLSMRVLFEPGFDFGRTPGTQEGKCNGLGGGSLPSGGTVPDGGGFTCRFIWKSNGTAGTAALKLYVYHQSQMNRTPGKAWGDTIDLGVTLVPGQWYDLRMQVAIDAATGNGRVDTYVNGAATPLQPTLCNGKKWVNAGVGVDTLLVETFYGGGDAGYAPAVQSAMQMDDIRVATTAPAAISGTFIDFWYKSAWTPAQWDAHMKEMQAIGTSTLIVQFSAYDEYIWCASQNTYSTQVFNTALRQLLDAAAANRMQVYVGLYFAQDYWTNPADATMLARHAQRSMNLAKDIWTQCGSAASFAGWYIPQEPCDYYYRTAADVALLRNTLINPVADQCRSLSGKPVAIAPFFNSSLSTTAQVRSFMADLASCRVDVMLLQDGIGVGHADLANVGGYFQAARDGLRGAGYTGELWADIELFDAAGKPAGIDRVRAQLQAVAGHVLRIASFQYFADMAPSGPNTTAAQVLRDAYRNYLNPSRPPVALAQSVTTTRDTAKTVTLSGSDPDGDALTYTIIANPAHGTLSGSGANRIYTPAAGYSGADSFTFTVHDGGTASAAATVSITVTAPVSLLPTRGDIGTVTKAGSTTESNGAWTLTAYGGTLSGKSDGFHMASQSVTGDVRITARIASVTTGNSWARSGIMIRAGRTANAPYAMTMNTAAAGSAFQRRLTAGAGTSYTVGPYVRPPTWVRLERLGSTIISSTSTDGTTWKEIGRQQIALPATLDVGLAVSGQASTATCTAVFTDVEILAIPAAGG